MTGENLGRKSEELAEEDSPVDLTLRGFDRQTVLEFSGFDVGYRASAIRSQTVGIDRVEYACAHLMQRLEPGSIDAAVAQYVAGATHTEILEELGLRCAVSNASSRLRAIFSALGKNPKRERYAPLTQFAGLFDEGTANDLACRGFSRAAMIERTGIDLGGARSRARDDVRGIDPLGYASMHVKARFSTKRIDELLVDFSDRRKTKEEVIGAFGLGSVELPLRGLFSQLGRADEYEQASLSAMQSRAKQAQERAHSPVANAKRTATHRSRAKDPTQLSATQKKFRTTMLERHGVENPLQLDSVQEKITETNRLRYGLDHHNQRPNRREAMRESMTTERLAAMQAGKDYSPEANKLYGQKMAEWWADPEHVKKALSVKRANGSWRDSQPERDLHSMLIEHFGRHDVEYQYRDPDRYPWTSDFYIPSRDLFIELNGFWTHGPHWYNPASDEDVVLLEVWKSKGTAFYQNAIENWTERDVAKREKAQAHELNYAVFWSYTAVDNAQAWLAAGAPDRTDWQ